ncbi:hypothetical protein B0I03_10224 [Flavobacterium aquaticum]|uniref:Uncharacterized protein n=1 Tax=Flavobacterium aquaticum TaxID=1236486 RepID=A0A327YWX0_9FLAO|nr:hypothetical protein [Flavobacterium aquaticum]RAK24175.1 hypothetical protein B0I03_10224 [Flavobacterium aquaticum]
MNNTKILEPKTEIIYPSYFSTGFPNKKWNEITSRENYISQIVMDLEENDLIFIEGDEDAGKTTICATFCNTYPNNTISIFFNPLNIMDYQIDYYFSNFVSQARLILGDNLSDIENEGLISIQSFNSTLFQLRRKFKNSKDKIYIIIDGLENNIEKYKELINKIFENIPFAENSFKVIITGKQTDFLDLNPHFKKISSKSITIIGFTKQEVISFLEIESPKENEIDELYKITKGFPGRLETSKRLIKKHGYSLKKILESETYNKWIELDCEKIELEDVFNNVVISIVALSNNSLHVNDLAKINQFELIEFRKKIENIFVLKEKNNYLNFVSNAHKKYFSNILRGNKSKVDELLEKFFLSEDNLSSKFELSKIYAEKREWNKIIPLINEEFLLGTIQSTGTLQRVNESIEMGYKAAEQCNYFADLLRYSIQGSIVNEFDNYLFWESEILARISLNDFTGAILLAESAVLKVDRLRLLALVAKKEKQINNKVDEDLISLIRELYKNTDLSDVGDVIYEIVTDLIYAMPNLAIEIIENSSNNSSNKDINDWIVAKLSVAAINSSSTDEGEQNKKISAIQKLNNPSVKKINQAISFLVGNYSSSRVLDEVKKLTDSEEKLKLLRLWLSNNNKHRKDVDLVINKALDELILNSSQSTLSIEILKELSFQLAYVNEFEKKKQIYLRFKQIEKNLTDLGLSKDKYIYQLNLFHTEFTLDKYKSISTLNNIIKEVEDLKDSLVRLEAFAEIYAKLHIISSNDISPKVKFVYHRIFEVSNELLNSTANHYKLCQNILKTISKVNPILGLKICESINTLHNRDKSRLLVLDSYLKNNLKKIKNNILIEIDKSFENIIPQRIALKSILERYSEAKSLHYDVIKELFYFTNKIDIVEIPINRVYCLLLNYQIISKNIEWKNRLSSQIKKKIDADWEKIDADWEKIDVGFVICSEIAKIDLDYAKLIFEKNVKNKNEIWIDSELIAQTYLYSLSLMAKAYNALLINNSNTENDYKLIEELIGSLPSEIEKLKLWTEIGISSYLSDNHSLTKKIYDTHVFPLVQGIIHKNLNIDFVLESLILVHLYNSELAIEYIKNLSLYIRESACSIIFDFYINKRNPFEIYDGEIDKYEINYNDLIKTISLFNLVETDCEVYNLINTIYKAIDNTPSNVISKIQLTEIISKLNSVIDNKFPDPKNINHDGYKIVSKIKLELLDKKNNSWGKYIQDAQKIPNLSDKLFVKAILLEDIPSDKISKEDRRKLFDEIINDLNCLDSHYEFVDRVIHISEKMYEINRTRWKDVVNKAFATSTTFEEGRDMYNYQKNIIDSIYRIDSSFAKELIKSIDNENNKQKNKKLLNEYLNTLEIANKIKNNETLEQKERNNNRTIIRALYKACGALNSGKITTKKIPDVAKYLSLGNKMPLHETIPVFLFYISNCSKVILPKNVTDELKEINKRNFMEIVKATNLIQILSKRRKQSETETKKFFIDEDFSSNLPVKPGNRESALAFIRNWMIDEMNDFVIYADSYFGVKDLEILKIIKEINPNIDINIIATDDIFQDNTEEKYKNYWKKISDEFPPFTNFTFCWLEEDKNYRPIHDRWIITKNGGLRLGTSFNSLGIKRDSEISVMKPNEALNILEEILKGYISRTKKEINKQRVSYKGFTL